MAQYDIAFVVNTASTGVAYQETNIKLAKGELLVGTATTPAVQAAATNGRMLVYDDTQPTGFTTKKWNEFDDLFLEGCSIKNAYVTNCYVYIGDDGLIEIVSSAESTGDGQIILQGQRTDLLAQDLYFPSIGGSGAHLTIDANGKVTRTTISSGGSNWTVNGANIYRNSKVGVKNSNPSYDLDVTGSIRATGDILSNSDARLKKSVQTLPSLAAKVKKLRPVSFEWIESGKSDVGLIAQEVEAIFPELVRTDDNGFKTINYSKLTVFLLKALQEII